MSTWTCSGTPSRRQRSTTLTPCASATWARRSSVARQPSPHPSEKLLHPSITGRGTDTREMWERLLSGHVTTSLVKISVKRFCINHSKRNTNLLRVYWLTFFFFYPILLSSLFIWIYFWPLGGIKSNSNGYVIRTNSGNPYLQILPLFRSLLFISGYSFNSSTEWHIFLAV